jgi:hypothetical protein
MDLFVIGRKIFYDFQKNIYDRKKEWVLTAEALNI